MPIGSQPANPPSARPPRERTLLVIIAVLLAALVIVPVAMTFVFVYAWNPYAGVQDLPIVLFSPVDQTPSAATFRVAAASPGWPASAFAVDVEVGGIYWSDLGDEGNLNDGDNFRVTGDGLPLASGSYTLYLLWAADLAQIQIKSWLM
ncbi:MAG: hypothetical protein A3K66_02140 [Euryarchaeota archaeon RBG_16_67_27]|nr:MAG: hypothetical protein A3K66_02140 [Euryarchaeota archaeon RBG_16_67_27]